MGLDQYLQTKEGEELIYWRKANQIHFFFNTRLNRGRGLDNCRPYYVSRKVLTKLMETCQQVIKLLDAQPKVDKRVVAYKELDKGTQVLVNVYTTIQVYEDTTEVQKLLPTMAGFFFGNTDIDEWYYRDVKDTAEKIKAILADPDYTNVRLYYYAWW